MAVDTDPGVGAGTPIGGGLAFALPDEVPAACVSFDRSLEVLMLGMKTGAYGLKSPDYCDVWWKAYQREGWIDKLRMAHSELKRDLGAPICPEIHLDELHPLKSRIRLRQAPVAALGVNIYTDWSEVNLTMDFPNEEAYMDLCDSYLDPGTITDAQVKYPDEILDDYRGLQSLQAPRLNRILATCGSGEDGYRLTWPIHQLVKPTIDETELSQTANFIDKVQWRVAQADATLTYELVGECSCGCCDNGDPTYVLTLEDATEGIVCVETEQGASCVCSDRQIRINYATMFGDGAMMDPALEQAITLLALVHSSRTPVKPRGCDKTFVKAMLELDPSYGTDFATKLRYGPTVAGMTVMRIVDKYLKRPHYNQPVMTGGLMSSRKLKKKRRRSSFLRG